MTTSRLLRVVFGVALLSAAGAAGWTLWQRDHRSSLTELAKAVGTNLDIEPRLSGGFLPGTETAARGWSVSTVSSLSPDARIAIARLEKQAAADQDVRSMAAVAVAYLIEGDVDRSIATLEDVTSMAEDAAAWSDLSAAYLVKAERAPARRIEYLAHALDTASRSIRVHPTVEARFNRSLALQALAPYVESTGEWDDYLRAEPDPRWAATARRHAETRVKLASVQGSWEERRKLLPAALEAHDSSLLADTAGRFPEATLEFFEQDVLIEWARGVTSGDQRAAAATLDRARALAAAWFTATRDPMLRDIVQRTTAASRNAADALALAQAHLRYREAVSKYRSDDYDAATEAIDAALSGFARAETPFWSWAALQKATVLFQLRQLDSADDELAPVEALARRRGYPTLLGRALRQRGLTQSKQWHLTEALAAFQESARSFEAGGEREDAVAVYSLIAANLRMLGEHHQSWEFIGRTLDGLGYLRTPLRRYLVLYNASLFASSQELFDAALLFQDAAVREAKIRGRGTVVEALTERATIQIKRGDHDHALADLREALSSVDAMPDGHPKQAARAETEILIAEVSQSQRQSPNIKGLPDAVAFFAAEEPAFVPRLYLGLARANLAAGSTDAAEAVFADGIAQLEAQHAQLGDDAFKISYFDESWNLFPEMIRFQLDVRHDSAKAFEYAERSRARSLGATSRPVQLSELRARLPNSTTVIYYVALQDRLLIWTVTTRGFALAESRTPRRDLARLISAQRNRLKEGRASDKEFDPRLYDALLRPIAGALHNRDTLVFMPDGDLQSLPFAALRDPDTHRYLIEDHAVLESPSASVFASGVTRLRQWSGQRFESALLVGNPVLDRDASSDLKPLPGSESEAIAAAQFYPRHEVLIGRGATKGRFVAAAGGYDVVHFGGHSVVNDEYPLLSRLSFSPNRDGEMSQSLFAHEISHIDFSHTRLVVLAACSTATGTVSRGEGVVSVARPFLAAGVPTVVASQWDVDDEATRQLFLAFHRAILELQDPVRALQSAQLSLLHGPNAGLALPRNWGAFVVLGASAQ